MSQSTNNLSTLNGLFKEVYADKLKELIPDGVKLLNKVKFMSKDKQPGNLYHQPVVLGMEHGITFASSDDDAFNLNAPVAGQIRDAQIKGNPMVMRSLLGYVSASRSAQGGQQAFQDATKFLVANMLRSMAKKLEIAMLYGQSGYGKVDSIATNTITIQTAEFAAGIWAGAEGMPIELYNGSTKRGEATVVSVDLAARTITLDAAPVGVANGDDIYHKGAFGNEFAGIHSILTIASGTLFNINVGTYNLFRGNEYSAASGALSFAKVQSATTLAIEKGLEGSLLCLVNPKAWANMLSDQAALRQYDNSYSSDRHEVGARSLKFHSQNGEIEIEPSIYVKEGFAYLLSMEDWSRVGSADMTFRRPGQGDEFFRDVENSAAYELRLYTDQSLFCCAPGRNTLIKDIVNS